MKLTSLFTVLAVAAVMSLLAAPAQADTVIRPGFNGNVFPGNDDGSVGPVGIGFTADFFGASYSQAYVNNNGNITFDYGLGTYTPFDLTSTSRKIIAPFFGDVDTRAGNVVTYGTGTVGGRNAFGVNWLEVGYYGYHTDKLNTFQLVLIDRSDINPGDFDFEFNYEQIQWETGDASGGSGGLGGSSARAGYSNGLSGVDERSYEILGSAINGALLDSNLSTGLIYNSLNSGLDGRYLFEVRNGQVQPVIPEPLTLTACLVGSALVGLKLRRRMA